MFRGASALVAGNSLKALARYSVYNSATQFMTDSSEQVSAPQVVVAGMMTGMLYIAFFFFFPFFFFFFFFCLSSDLTIVKDLLNHL
jgi:hypothetical protein